MLLGAHASAEAAAPSTASVITAPVAATAATEATAPAGAGLSVAASPCSEDLGSTIGAQRAVMMDTDRRESERRAAAAAVPHCRDDRLVELWIEALDDPVLLPFAVRGLARQANARSEEAVLRVLREPRSRVRALINLEAAATITSVPWMVRWATDATLPQPLRTDLRPALYRVARVNDFPRHLLPPRPVRWVGPAVGGAAVGALGFSLLGTVNGNARVALAAGVPIGAAVGGGAAAAWAYFSEQLADTALRLGTYPLWGGGWMLGWASTIEPLTLDNARRAVGLSLLGAGAGFAGAILDRPEAVSPARQALVDFGLGAGGLGGLSLAHLAFPTASDVGRWSAISVGGVAGGLLGALHARGGSATRADRVALSAWPLLAMGSFRLFQSAATTATMTARERWILWVAPTDTDQAAWTGLGLAAGTYGALIVVGLNTGAPGEYLDREILPIASGGLYGATLLPLAAAAVKPNDIPEIWSGLGLHLGLATSLAVGGFADLDGVAASTGLVGGAWFGAAAIGVELLLPPAHRHAWHVWRWGRRLSAWGWVGYGGTISIGPPRTRSRAGLARAGARGRGSQEQTGPSIRSGAGTARCSWGHP